MRLKIIRKGAYDVSRLQAELAATDAWDAIRLRTEPPGSPHREVSDIWVRYNPIENYDGDMRTFNNEHTSEWYPVDLPETRALALRIGKDLKALSIGAVLVTKIPPGKQVYPHVDQGWHARHYEKFALQVKGNDKQAFHFQDEDLVTHDGDLFWFDNAYPHWVTNDSDQERITLIVCVRRMPCH
jgi:hypothetical protein